MSDAAYFRGWRERNPERARQIQARYRHRRLERGGLTPEQLERKRANDRRSYRRHRVKRLKAVARYRRTHDVEIAERDLRYRENHQMEIAARHRKYYVAHRAERLAAMEKYRRSRGIAPNGQSGPEIIVHQLLCERFGPQYVLVHDRSTLKNPTPGGQYLELDFLVPAHKLAVEVQGVRHRKQIHGKDALKEVKRRDALKRRLCRKLGLRLVEIQVEDGAHYARPGKRKQLAVMVLAQLSA